jgi:hypothetical protein
MRKCLYSVSMAHTHEAVAVKKSRMLAGRGTSKRLLETSLHLHSAGGNNNGNLPKLFMRGSLSGMPGTGWENNK